MISFRSAIEGVELVESVNNASRNKGETTVEFQYSEKQNIHILRGFNFAF